MLKHVSDFDELKLHYYPEEVHRSFCYCYIPLVLCGESFESLNIVFPTKHPHQWGIIKLAIYKCVA